jgi:hypothetical protein
MSGVIPPLPQYAFMARCSVTKKHGDNFTFTLLFWIAKFHDSGSTKTVNKMQFKSITELQHFASLRMSGQCGKYTFFFFSEILSCRMWSIGGGWLPSTRSYLPQSGWYLRERWWNLYRVEIVVTFLLRQLGGELRLDCAVTGQTRPTGTEVAHVFRVMRRAMPAQ